MNNNNEIQNELHTLGIHIPKHINALSNVSNTYFDSFAEEMTTLVRNESFIEKLPKHTPYTVPENYFNNFSKEMMQQVTSTKILPMRPRYIIFKNIAVAASILLLVGLGFVMMQQNASTSTQNATFAKQLQELEDATVENYITKNEFEFEQDFETATYNDKNIDVEKLEKEVLKQSLDNIDINEIDINTL